MRQRRLTALCVAALCGTLVVTACGSPGGGNSSDSTKKSGDVKSWGSPKGTVTFWDTNATPQLTAEWKKLIGEFEKSHPDIKVKYSGLPNSSYVQKVDNAIASGTTPDLVLYGNKVAGLIAQHALTPLDAAYKSSGLINKVDPVDITSERQLAAADHKIYDAPLTALSDTIYYRTDWLKKAGLPAPTTYAQLFSDAKALTDKKAGRFGWAFRGGSGSDAPLFANVYGISGVPTFFTKDGKCTLDDAANVAAFKKYISLYHTVSAPADVNNDYPKMVAEFDNGSAWAMHHNLGSYQDNVKALGAKNIAGVPGVANKNGVTTVTSPAISGLAMFAKSKHKAAAWEFIKWMSTTGNSEWAQTVGQMPANKAAQGDAWITKSQPLQAILKLSKNPKTQYLNLPTYLPEYATITQEKMDPDLQAVLKGSMKPEAFLHKYAQLFDTAQADFKKNN